MDNTFIDKLTGIVLDNLRDEDFSVDKLAGAAGMSHTTLYRRLKAARNQDVTGFIKEVRLEKAKELLSVRSLTISEIAYNVGFGSPTYFIKCFGEYYGLSPGEARKVIYEEQEKEAVNQPPKEIRQPKLKFKGRIYRTTKRLKNSKKLIAWSGLLVVTLIVIALFVLPGKIREKSIVVLPFSNLSEDPGNQYFADGIMEDILNYLYHISEMRVVSRTSSEYFRGKQMTSPQIAKALHVNYVLEGSVQKNDQEVRIFIQLIDARNDQHLLSEKYEGNIASLFPFLNDMAKKIADNLNAAISQKENGQIDENPTSIPEAYDHYLKARFFLHKANDIQRFDISREGLLTSLEYYEKAIAADSTFAEAYAGLANAWYNLSAWGWYHPYSDGIQKAINYCSKALEIDPDCAEAHAIKGVYHAYPERRFEEARRELRIALELKPNFSTTHQWYAQLMMITGPIEEARKHINLALEQEPYFWVVHNLNSWIYYFEEKYNKGLEASFEGFSLNPYSSDNNWLFILHYVKLGRGGEAANVIRNVFSQDTLTSKYGEEVIAVFNEEGIKGIFKWLIDININKPLPLQGLNGNPYYIAWWHAIIGNKEESIYWFEKTLESERIPMHYFNLIAQNPDFDLLRDDPRFLAVIEKAGLAPYHTRTARQE